MDKGTTKLAYMRAALSSLATIHGTTFSFMRSIGGKEALLEQFHTIKEHHLPRNKVVRRMVEESMLPFLMYMTRVQPDIAQQLMVESSQISRRKSFNYHFRFWQNSTNSCIESTKICRRKKVWPD